MKTRNVEEVYAANDAVKDELIAFVCALPRSVVEAPQPDGGWSIGDIVEHVAIVDEGMAKICAKLLRKVEADRAEGDGTIVTTDEFYHKLVGIAGIKMEAPGMVQPSRKVALEESITRLDANRSTFDALKPLFKQFDAAGATFPHPYLGELNAGEWLMLAGGHAQRHLDQIRRLAEGIQA